MTDTLFFSSSESALGNNLWIVKFDLFALVQEANAIIARECKRVVSNDKFLFKPHQLPVIRLKKNSFEHWISFFIILQSFCNFIEFSLFVLLQCDSLNQGGMSVHSFGRYMLATLDVTKWSGCRKWILFPEQLQLNDDICSEAILRGLWALIRIKGEMTWSMNDSWQKRQDWIAAQILIVFHDRIWSSLLLHSHSHLSKINSQDSLAQLYSLYGDKFWVLYSNRHSRKN